MGKVFEQIIDRFDGGLSEDKRSKRSNKFSITKHFDTFTYPHKLVPYIKTEAVEDKTYKITKFLNAIERNGSTEYIYGFGVDVGSSNTEVYRILPSGTSWGSGANNTSGLAKKEGMFFLYKGYIYMYAGTTKLIRYDTSGSDAFNDAYQTLTAFSSHAQAVHHPADDIAYFFTDNKVHKLNDTSWSEAKLTLPDNLKIVDACAYGNYLAIACVTKESSNPQSIVYLWDRDSSLTTLTERIDFGIGTILHIANLNNRLTVVMDFGSQSTLSLNKPKLLVKQAFGQFGVTINELVSDEIVGSGANSLLFSKVIEGDKLYFPRKIPLNGDNRNGIWVVDSKGNITLDFVEEEVESAGVTRYDGILKTTNAWWIAFGNDGSVNRSDDNYAYSTTLASVYESLIFNGGKSSKTKRLISVGVMTEPLPSAGQIVLKYRADGDLDTDWSSATTIFTNTTDDDIYHEAISVESDNTEFAEFKEIQFLIESTGGAVITGLKFKYEEVPDELSD